MKNLALWDRINQEDMPASQEELEQIIKEADFLDSPFGGMGTLIDKVIYEDMSEEDDDEYDWEIRAVRLDKHWYIIANGQESHMEFALSDNSYEEKNYKVVEFEGKEYTLTEDAYLDGDGDYHAAAEDAEGNEFEVVWETCQEYDNAYELAGLEEIEPAELTEEQKDRIKKLQASDLVDINDESNACDWDNPVEVIKL